MRLWAWAARYGNQQLSELQQMTMTDLNDFVEALGDIVRRENGDDLEPVNGPPSD